jgi:hypothetical protein
MPWFESTAIRRGEYDADQGMLFLWFREDPAPYSYFRVPPEVFDALCEAESQGRYFHQHIDGHYEFAPPADKA